MAVAHKGSTSMGLVLIPIGIYKATVGNDIHFNQLEKESKARIKYKKYCSHCGKDPFRILPVGNEDVVWVAPDHVCVVEYMPNTLDFLRQPVFKGFRDDVFPEEIQIEKKD